LFLSLKNYVNRSAEGFLVIGRHERTWHFKIDIYGAVVIEPCLQLSTGQSVLRFSSLLAGWDEGFSEVVFMVDDD
jgi:hypothetical protein